jgi:hypothetical protein
MSCQFNPFILILRFNFHHRLASVNKRKYFFILLIAKVEYGTINFRKELRNKNEF